MEDIKQQLINSAIEKGVCLQGQKHMDESDIASLVDYYVQNPDWCLERDYPALDTLIKYFSNVTDFGVYVGEQFQGETLTKKQTYILHHCCGLIYTGLDVATQTIPMFYVANGCRIKFRGVEETVKGVPPSVVPITVYGKNDVSARSNGAVRFSVSNANFVKPKQ